MTTRVQAQASWRRAPFSHEGGNKLQATLGYVYQAKRIKVSDEQLAFYARRVGPKLRAYMEQIAADRKAHDVSEELDIARTVASEAVAVYGAIYERDFEGKQVALEMSGEIVMQRMRQVIDLFHKSAQIAALEQDKFSPHIINEISKQIMRFAHVCFSEYPNALVKFDQLLTEELQLPSIKMGGTTITPDQQVLEMDSTVPLVEVTE